MEIKIQCDCGQKFKFDVEPVDGRMPWEVTCPVCGASGTEKANQVLQQFAPAPAPTTVPVARIIPVAAPVPSGEAPKARLSISRPPAAPPAAEPAAPPVLSPVVPRPVARVTGAGTRAATPVAVERDGKTPNFWLSVAAVLLGAILGLTLWHLGYRMTGWRLGFMALVTGCAAGAAPQVLGHYKGVAMGLIAAFVTFVAIFTAQFLNAKVEVKEIGEESTQQEYQAAVEEAKAVLAAAPNATDQEIRAYLAKEQSFEGFVVTPAEIDAEEIEQVRRRLPMMQELANGQIKAEEYQARERAGSEREEYEIAVTEAKRVVASAPNGTEQEFRVYLAKEYSGLGVTVTPAEIEAEAVEEMQAEFPRMRQLVDGSLSREQYLQQEQAAGVDIDETDIMNFYLIFRTLGIFNIINIVLGIGAAFLTAKG